MSCRVAGCKNSSARRDPLVLYYAFPKNDPLRIAWKSACGDKTINLASSTLAVCQEHFKESDYIPRAQTPSLLRQTKMLKFGALPTENLPDNAYTIFPNAEPRFYAELDDKPQAPVQSAGTDREIASLKQELIDLKRKSESQVRMISTYEKVFSIEQVRRIFTGKGAPISRQVVEQAVQDFELKSGGGAARSSKKTAAVNPAEPGPSSANPMEDVVETFNEYVKADDEDAVNRYVLRSNILITVLKTS